MDTRFYSTAPMPDPDRFYSYRALARRTGNPEADYGRLIAAPSASGV
jgi:hypothetical protein